MFTISIIIIGILPFIIHVAHFQNTSRVPVPVDLQTITRNNLFEDWATLPSYLFSLPNNTGLNLDKILKEFCHNEPDCFSEILNPIKYFTLKRSCFKYLGCFSNRYPWRSLLRPAKPPDPPRKVCTTAILYTRQVSNLTLQIYPEISPKWSEKINLKLKTTVICHGLLDSGNAPWVANMSRAILERRDENVIVLDWGKGAGKEYIEYFRVLGNMRVAAAVLFRLLRELKIHPKDMHFIGHSLGAHALAYVSRMFHRKVAWLTGLDPAGPFFEGFSPTLRMVKRDAVFTEAIHSNVGVAGDVTKDGDCDFYLNVGFLQPSCLAANKAFKIIFCAHEASYQFYTLAIEHPKCYMGTPESLIAIFGATLNTVAQGTVSSEYNKTLCGDEQDRCVPMGLESIQHKQKCLQGQKMDWLLSFGYHGNYVVFTGTNSSQFTDCPNG